jgi:Domain of unknown function (DUF4345)
VTNPSRIFLSATALVYLGFGLWGLLSPEAMVANFGIVLGGPDGATMIRASYGGFLIGDGLLFGWCAMAEMRNRIGLVAVVLLTLPILLSRLAGMVLDRAASPYHQTYAGIELIGVCVALFLLRRSAK